METSAVLALLQLSHTETETGNTLPQQSERETSQELSCDPHIHKMIDRQTDA